MRIRRSSKLIIKVLFVFLVIGLLPVSSDVFARTKAVTVKYAATAPEIDVGSRAQEWMLSEIEKKAGGSIKFDRFWAGSLAPGPKILDAVTSGIVDAGQLIIIYYESVLPLHTVTNMPGTGGYSTWSRAQAFFDLYDKSPEMADELDRRGLMPFAVYASTGMNIISKKPLRRLSDIKGLKVRCVGSGQAMMKALGAIPVGLSFSETYTGFERGTVDATFQDASAQHGLKLWEIGKYFTRLRQADTMLIQVIRKDVYNRLHESAKAAINEMMGEKAIDGMEKSYFKDKGTVFDFSKTGFWAENGIEVIELGKEDQAELKSVEAKVREQWLSDYERKGIPMDKVYIKYKQLLGEWEKKCPADLKDK